MNYVKYHKFTGGIPIVFVERFKDFASMIGAKSEDLDEGTQFDDGNYCRTIGFKKSPLKFIVFEDAMMRTLFGHRRNDVVDATLAMHVGQKKFPKNERKAMNHAIGLAVENNASGAYDLLNQTYARKFKAENPFHQVAITEGMIKEFGDNTDKHSSNDDDKEKYRHSHTHVSGGEGNLYVKGEMPQEKAQAKANKQGADTKLVKGKMVNLSSDEKAAGASGNKQSQASGEAIAGEEPPAEKEKKIVIDKATGKEASPEQVAAISKGETPEPKVDDGTSPGDFTPNNASTKAIDKAKKDLENLDIPNDDGTIKAQIDSAFDKMLVGQGISTAEKQALSQYIRPSLSGKYSYSTTDPGNFTTGRHRSRFGGKPLVDILGKYGVEGTAATTGKSGKASIFKKKDLNPSNVFRDENNNVVKSGIQIETLDKGFKIGSTEISRISMPKGKDLVAEMVKRGMSKDKALLEADRVQASIRKHNGITNQVEKVLAKGSDSLDIIDVLPGTTPDTKAGRKKLQDISIKMLHAKMKSLGGDSSIIDKILPLGEANAEEFDGLAMEFLNEIWADDGMAAGVADLVEIISYARHLSKGKVVYMPQAANFPLGDVITMTTSLGGDLTVSEILDQVDIITTSVDNRSIKKDQGGASSSKIKYDLCATKPARARKDLIVLADTYDDIYGKNPDLKKAEATIMEQAKRYGHNPKELLKKNAKSIDTAINAIKKDWPNIDHNEKELRKKLALYMVSGLMQQEIHNATVDVQYYSNERYANNKTKESYLDVADGVNRMAMLKFAFSAGKWGSNGRPGNPYPTRFHHVDREDVIKERMLKKSKKGKKNK